MRKFGKKKYVAAGAVAVVILGSAGAALAYWTAGGTGSGSASTANTNGITINQTTVVTGLYPGGSPVTISGNFDNPNASKVFVHQVSVAFAANWSKQADLSKPACTAADFTLTQPNVTDAEITSGSGVGSWTGATLKLNDSATNQDNCKNVTVDLVYTSN